MKSFLQLTDTSVRKILSILTFFFLTPSFFPSEDRESHKDGVNGFADLIGKDLTAEERALASHAAKLRVTGAVPSWTPSHSGTIVEEPEAYDEEFERDSSLDLSDDSSSIVCEIPAPVLNRTGTLNSDPWRLEPEEVVRLLINEFGPLAPGGEEEKLLLETDGGLIHDVAIVGSCIFSFVLNLCLSTQGVLHLTSHRLAFHASLMAAQRDTKKGVLRSGPVVMHRKGWRSKKRLWLELSHDMLCTYPSSSDNDKIRPVRSVLCMLIVGFLLVDLLFSPVSAVDKVAAFDPKHPKWLRIIFKKPGDDQYSGFAEFDTEEATRDWRKELTGLSIAVPSSSFY